MKSTQLCKRYKKKYSTSIILQYKTGKLPDHIVKQIPKSTRQYWNTMKLEDFFGYDVLWNSYEEFRCISMLARYKRLQDVAKVLANIVLLYKNILNASVYKKELLRNNATSILKTINICSKLIGLKKSLRFLGITYQQYYAWVTSRVCSYSTLGFCPSKHPFQVTKTELLQLKKYMNDPSFQTLSAASVYCKLKRDSALLVSISTFYKYVRLLHLQRIFPRKRNNKNTTGIRATKPLAILHMDITIFRTIDNIKVYLYVIQDNFSRAILGLKASLLCNPEICLANLKNVLSQYTLSANTLLITDGGNENKGKLSQFISSSKEGITRLIAQVDIKQSNSMIEAVNKKIKYRFLYNMHLPNFESVLAHLPILKDMYNDTPLLALSAYTPLEVLHGALPDRTRFAPQIKNAIEERKSINQKVNCDDVCKAQITGSF